MAQAWEHFRRDLQKFYFVHCETTTPSLRQKLELWLEHFGLHCVALYRFGELVGELAHQRPSAALPLKLLRRLTSLTMALCHHVEINAEIGPGFYIGHAANIFVGPTKIGKNFSVTHNVTIGVGHSHGVRGLPVIGDNVWVGTGSVLCGAIEIGDGVAIAHGSMLSRSVPDRCLVAGNPARPVQANYDNRLLLAFGQPPLTLARGTG